jgi:uncharacterized repeat protein (TIGR02543 family)
MKKQRTIFFITATILCLLFLSCEAVATLFHGPKPEEPPVSYIVTFDVNGAEGTPPPVQTVNAGTIIRLPDKGGLNKTGFIFVGWNESFSGTSITYSVGDSVSVTRNMVFYAQWLDGSTPQYTVSFNANGATSGTPPVSQTVYSGISITIPNQGSLVCNGKIFDGWNTLANGGGTNYVAGALYTVTGDVTLYAKWQSSIQYTVTYNTNGASGNAPTAQTVDAGTEIILPGVGNMNFLGRIFDGWNTQANGSGTKRAEGATYIVNANTSFYAQWSVIPIIPEGSTLEEKLTYIRSSSGNGILYDVVVDNNEFVSPQVITSLGNNISVIIRSINPTNVRYIQLDSAGSLFLFGTNITMILRDIELRGISNNNRALISVNQNGKLILDSGSKITMNANPDWSGDYSVSGGGVYVYGGTLEMNDGAEIINNTTGNAGGGITVYNGNITMRGGLISGNTGYQGGGIYINSTIYLTNDSVVTMNGGIISKNTAYISGGGIFIGSSGNRFTKYAASGSNTSGTIYGSNGDDNSNIAPIGTAIYAGYPERKRELTLGLNDEISTLSNAGWE